MCIGVCMYTEYILYNLSDIVAVAVAGAVVVTVNVSGLALRLAVYFRHTTVRISNFRNVALCLQYAQEKKVQQKVWQVLLSLLSLSLTLTVAGCGPGSGSASGFGCGCGCGSGLIYKLLPGCAL